jgi:PIN domain nuclease of toxin-antitoxin system
MPAVRPAAILIDTHAFLWSILEPAKLSRTARRILERPNTRIYLSVASLWEISLKVGRGKLTAPDSVIDAQIASLGIIPLPIGLPHIRALTALNVAEGHPRGSPKTGQ